MSVFRNVQEYHTRLLTGQTSCEQTVMYFLERIQAHAHLNAFIHIYADEALHRARAIDQRIQREHTLKRLTGVVLGIKDVIAYAGHPLTAASRMLQNFRSLFSATAVERLLAEEAIIIGSLNCDEFAMGSSTENSFFGPTLHPLNPEYVPGGSSGGSAAAVSADLCMLALGSDTGGSVRQPADFCGIIGLKPTYGRVSRHGLIAYASSFDQIGIFGKNIADVATTLEVIAGPDEYDSTASPLPIEPYLPLTSPENKPWKLAYMKEALEHPSLDQEISAAIRSLIKRLNEEGHIVNPVHFTYLDVITPAYYVLTTAEASANLARYDGIRYGYHTSNETGLTLEATYRKTRSEGFGREVKRRILLGTYVLSEGYYEAYYTKAQQVRRLVAQEANRILDEYACLLMPTFPSTAFRLGEKTDDPVKMYLGDVYTVFANLAGLPAISIPLFTHSNGLPFGIQLVAGRFREKQLLQVADYLCTTFSKLN
ncbi:MAG: Asp-tRNA(Asn)/Glu-tRNA(Gln) amidotransferase subunit GatA [Thermoflavifilum sp.]|nr:Asp-tRNA(Asn)/Glu-tRNA(Gln) amidotransferase subunit GatA [Thermoflavifilum sp.]